MVLLKEKWIEAEIASFKESKSEDGKRDLILEALIVPYDKISRNGVKYNTESIKATHKMLEGKPLNHNHVTSGADVLPRGKWIETWLEDDGMHGKAKVFDTDYNKDYIEWLEADSEPRVSLQVTGDAKQLKEEKSGKYYREATIKEWLETSTVTVPGFDAAKGNMGVAISECFGACELVESLQEKDKIDTVEMNIPLLTRIFEYVMEDNIDDVALHKILENIIKVSKENKPLTMDNYKDIILENLQERDRDGTGPNGEGPRTGRGKGDCEDTETESIKPGKYKTRGGETITVHSVNGNKATISGNDAKNKEIDIDALDKIIVKSESLLEAGMKDIQSYINDLIDKGKSEKDIIKSVIKKFHMKKDEVEDIMDEQASEEYPTEFFKTLENLRLKYI